MQQPPRRGQVVFAGPQGEHARGQPLERTRKEARGHRASACVRNDHGGFDPDDVERFQIPQQARAVAGISAAGDGAATRKRDPVAVQMPN